MFRPVEMSNRRPAFRTDADRRALRRMLHSARDREYNRNRMRQRELNKEWRLLRRAVSHARAAVLAGIRARYGFDVAGTFTAKCSVFKACPGRAAAAKIAAKKTIRFRQFT